MTDRSSEIRSTRAPTPLRSTRAPAPLREDQIEILRRYGQTRETEAGQVLFRAGDSSNDFLVILEGEVEIIDDFAGEVRSIGFFKPGMFLGDLHMLTGQGVPLSAVVSVGGEVLAIPRERLKEVVTEEFDLSNIILDTFLARRSYPMMIRVGPRIIA